MLSININCKQTAAFINTHWFGSRPEPADRQTAGKEESDDYLAARSGYRAFPVHRDRHPLVDRQVGWGRTSHRLRHTPACACSSAASGLPRLTRCSSTAPSAMCVRKAARSCFSTRRRAPVWREKTPGAARASERLRRTYAIVGDGVVIAVGHRYRRIPRD